jgi:hypothetical protein
MNNKEVFEQLKTLSSDMEGKLSQLLSLNNKMLSNLDPDKMPVAKEVINDINKIKEALKKGDETALNELNKKYASSRNE